MQSKDWWRNRVKTKAHLAEGPQCKALLSKGLVIPWVKRFTVCSWPRCTPNNLWDYHIKQKYRPLYSSSCWLCSALTVRIICSVCILSQSEYTVSPSPSSTHTVSWDMKLGSSTCQAFSLTVTSQLCMLLTSHAASPGLFLSCQL